MPKVKDVIGIMQKIAPEKHAYNKEYDNVGLMVGDGDATVSKVLCCLDVTQDVIDEAITVGANLIISHHPLIFCPIKNVTTSDTLGRKITTAIRNGVAIYSAHTNLDFVRDGINDFVAHELGLKDITPMDAYISKDEGFGRVGNLDEKMSCLQLKAKVASLLSDDYVRIIGVKDSQCKRVAVINGAGGGDVSYIDMAICAGADTLVTADVKHHVAVYAKDNGITVVEPQHYTMEYVYISKLVRILREQATSQKVDLEILQSQRDVNARF